MKRSIRLSMLSLFTFVLTARSGTAMSCGHALSENSTTQTVFRSSDLEESFLEAWSFLRGEQGPRVYAELLDRYGESGRAYHNLSHIIEGLEILKAYFAANPTPQIKRMEIIIAWWFHDAVYGTTKATNGQDNEQLSYLAFKNSAKTIPVRRKLSIKRLIAATKTHRSMDRSNKIMIGTDLAILGQSPERFAAYELGVRREYAWVPDDVFDVKRAEAMREFARREPLYRLPFFEKRFGAQARVNLKPYQ